MKVLVITTLVVILLPWVAAWAEYHSAKEQKGWPFHEEW